jgi:urea transporter
MSFLSLVRPSLYLICFNDSFDKDLLSVQLLLRQLINEYHSPLLNMAFVVKNMILALALAFFALVNLSVAGALPSVGGLEIDMTNSLVARNTSMEAGCPAGQSPVQAGW